MRWIIVLALAVGVATVPARASNHEVLSSTKVNASKSLQLAAVLYPSLTALCADEAVFARVTDTSLTDAQRQAAGKKHDALLATLPSIKRTTKVFVVETARVNCTGDPDPNPVAQVRVVNGKYRDDTGWIFAETFP
jgi:hypothetical protein